MDRFDYDPLLAELRQAVRDLQGVGKDPVRCTADLIGLAAIAQCLGDNADGPVDPGEILFSLFSKSVALMTLRASRESTIALSTKLLSLMMVIEAQQALFPTFPDELSRVGLPQEGFH